jgi:uncharacterized membrane protein YesL
MSAFDRLLEQIDAFIRKYYKNEMLKGVLVFVGFLLSSWLLVSTLEYFGQFSSTVRFILLISFVLGNGTFCLITLSNRFCVCIRSESESIVTRLRE